MGCAPLRRRIEGSAEIQDVSGPLAQFQWITIATGSGVVNGGFDPNDFTFLGPAPGYEIQATGDGADGIGAGSNPEPGTTFLFRAGLSTLLLGRWRRP
jgi:hypothetical protein